MIISVVYLVFNIYFSGLLVNGIKNVSFVVLLLWLWLRFLFLLFQDNPHHILGWLIYNGAFIVILSFNIAVVLLFITWKHQLSVLLLLSVWVYFWLSIFSLYQKIAKDYFKPMPSVIYQVPEYQNPQIEKKVGTMYVWSL